ncbi:colicin Z C-terminal domain-related protein [Superficieibacter sp. 1612_C1]|uniref:colicin Z C-terminal domain-related protein n=1 Tax=Superficieibacter sp. 1612_C1 TaxID=2780382 RepID=UPI001D16C18B|nr:colicin Z C-terminal domain-related protein [Superficieibacter sp. 1612_C1]
MSDSMVVIGTPGNPTFGGNLVLPGGFGSNAPNVPVSAQLVGGAPFRTVMMPDGKIADVEQREMSEIKPDTDSLPVGTKVVIENGTQQGYHLISDYIPIEKTEETITVLSDRHRSVLPRMILTDGTYINFDSWPQLYAFANRSKEKGDGSGQNHGASTQAYAGPLSWGPWVDLAAHTGQDVYTISFDTASQAPSTFDVQIEYAGESSMVTVNTMGPGSYKVTDNNGAGTDRIRFKSHSVGQNISIQY